MVWAWVGGPAFGVWALGFGFRFQVLGFRFRGAIQADDVGTTRKAYMVMSGSCLQSLIPH